MSSGEDQERFEDYLELERYIEELQAGQVAHPPRNLTPDQARIYQMATLFHAASASSDDASPRSSFVANLQAQLEQETQQPEKKRLPFFRKNERLPRPSHVSRRALLTGGAAAAVAAASLAVGAGLDHVIETGNAATGTTQTNWPALVPSNVPSTWMFVTTLAELGSSVKRFATDSVVGFVLRTTGSGRYSGSEEVIAMSAACTHMGCIVQWNSGDGKFHCPCHGGIFTKDGEVDNQAATFHYLSALPRFDVQVDTDGKIFVRVPTA